MAEETIKEKFDQAAKTYDKSRKLLIPCFEDFYKVTVDLADSVKEKPKILDLGAGTGLLTSYLFKKHENAEFTLIDMSHEMLKAAKRRFKSHDSFKYIVADYSNYNFEDSFDIIVSSLSIHHLEDKDKEKLYRKVYNTLNGNGIFLNADQILGPTKDVEKRYQRNWMEKIKSQGISEDKLKSASERMKFDKPALLEDNLKWLTESGFADVDIYYKYYNFGVFYGKKKEK
jgi:tRNA (cmo5U34)-methyltransferase